MKELASSRRQKLYNVMLASPICTLTALFVFWKGLLLLAIVASPGPGYDTSTTLLPTTALKATGAIGGDGGFKWPAFPGSLLKLARWDAIYFLNIARRGYLFEQEWAFSYGYTKILAALSFESVPETLHLAVIGIGLSHICHYLSVLSLYGMTQNVFGGGNPALPLLAAAFHIISPAGAFLSAPYGEPIFAFLNFTGYYAYTSALRDERHGRMFTRDGKFLLAGALFAFATAIRSNGIFSGILFAYDAVLGVLSVLSNGISLSQIHRMIFVVIGGSLILLGTVVPQYYAFTLYCRDSEVPRSWCNNTIPSIYTWVQDYYWGSGKFLGYWTVSNLPLFALAAPMLIVLWVSAWWPFKWLIDSDVLEKHAGRDVTVERNEHRQACLYRLAIPQAVLGILGFTHFHVQIINRISSGYPVWYWYLAFRVLEDKRPQTGFLKPSVFVRSMMLYALIQGGLFASFLPPA
ncbi:ER membrane glycoprotein subunit of the GPI transamidase complex-like protein [Onygenales sp. PD_40]|nr:ER membrane glycoprotein subunit of the GPI transamidase complex-like protein [Onygenales sp. PD_40]